MEEKILSEEFHMTLQSTSAYHFLFNLFSDAFIKDLGAEILCSLENSVKKKKTTKTVEIHIQHNACGGRGMRKSMNPCVSATTKFYLSRYENLVVQKKKKK